MPDKKLRLSVKNREPAGYLTAEERSIIIIQPPDGKLAFKN